MQSEYASTLLIGRRVQSERIIAPYRTQRPLTRRKPAAQACRTAVLRLHTPLTRCMPGPHASRTGVTMSSSCWMGATGMACVDEARPKRKTTGTSFLILLLPNKRVGASFASISNQLNRTFHCPNGSCAYPIVQYRYDLVQATARIFYAGRATARTRHWAGHATWRAETFSGVPRAATAGPSEHDACPDHRGARSVQERLCARGAARLCLSYQGNSEISF